MPKKKLTLHLDADVIQKAKALAAARGTSVSAMFSNLIHTMATPTSRHHRSVAPTTRELRGVATLSPDDQHKTDRQLFEAALSQKHGL